MRQRDGGSAVVGFVTGVNTPLMMVQPPGDDRMFVIEQFGRIKIIKDGKLRAEPFLDIRSKIVKLHHDFDERGLLGIAFHPDFTSNGYIYVHYTATGPNSSTPLISHTARFTTNNGGDSFDPASEFTVLTVDQPYTNHNGGKIGFGTDGYLYIGLGDGGSGGDPQNHAQNTNDLLGAMLRIDVDSGSPYAIPADNPFAGGGGRAEIYAWGLRNPWRWSFDQFTDALWLGDVGQSSWEEVDIIVNGGNYGWRCYEGTHAYNTSGCAPASNYIMPVAEYGRTEGASITGGYVYRGTAIPALTGVYVFTDFSSGTIWGLFPTGTGDYRRDTLIPTTGSGIAAMAQGNDGELYLLNLYNNQIHRLTRDALAPGDGPPVQLSATGCVDPGNPAEPAAGLIPYAVNLSFWSDAAEKERYLAVPDGATIGIAADGDFDLPHGSVLLKHFRLNGNLIETRFVVRRDDGSWAGYTYEWNASRTDAQRMLADAGDGTRAALANQLKADLFVSIHANAVRARGAKGSEFYFLSYQASDEESRRMAQMEGAAEPLGSVEHDASRVGDAQARVGVPHWRVEVHGDPAEGVYEPLESGEVDFGEVVDRYPEVLVDRVDQRLGRLRVGGVDPLECRGRSSHGGLAHGLAHLERGSAEMGKKRHVLHRGQRIIRNGQVAAYPPVLGRLEAEALVILRVTGHDNSRVAERLGARDRRLDQF